MGGVCSAVVVVEIKWIERVSVKTALDIGHEANIYRQCW